MKITVINGQNHKGSTYNIGKLLVDEISGEKEVTEFFLPRDLNHFCIGCFKCVEDETKCLYYKEKNIIMSEVEESDLIIITTPTYCLAPSAALKSFLDLTFTYWMPHKPRACMFRKKAVVISTAAGTGTSKAIEPVARTLFYWGIPWIKKYGVNVQASKWSDVSEKNKTKIKRDMARIAKKISKNKKPHISIKIKVLFNLMASMQKADKGSGHAEREYWKKNGWLEKARPWK